MNIKDIANHFSVYIFSQDVDLGVSLKLSLIHSSFQAELFSNHEDLLSQAGHLPPHIVVLDISTSIVPVHELFQKILNISSEIKIIIVSPEEYLSDLSKYKEYNLIAAYSRDNQHVASYVQSACELQAEIFYRLFQNEQVYEELKLEKKAHADLTAVLIKERSASTVRPYQIRISEYRSCHSKEELFDVFYRYSSQQSWIYLKFIPSIQTFIAVSYHQVPEVWVEGLSYKVPVKDSQFLNQIFQGVLPESFSSYLCQKTGVDKIQFIPLLIKDQVEGLLISSQEISASSAEDFSLMSLVYTNMVYESQPRYMDIEDQLTGFYNHLFYKRVLEKEIDRSKRSFTPLSVVKVSIDKFIEIESTLGKAVADDIIKKVADLIKQTSRLPDYICRTNENEFSLVLVNCSKSGAVVRAERLRKELSLANYSQSGILITVSQGVSEYPTLASNADELNLLATKALSFISEKGSDKIAISKAPPAHKPDFVVDA